MNHQPIYAWAAIPSLTELASFLDQHPENKMLLMRLPENRLPEWSTSEQRAFPELAQAWQDALLCVQFQAANVMVDFLPNCTLWLLPASRMMCLHEHFRQPVLWQDTAVTQKLPENIKPWFTPPQPHFVDVPQVLVIGAGIAGAATAYELAQRGAKVCVLEAATAPALAASGNQQGLLYAKISPYPTMQTELLLQAYGYTRRLLTKLLPEQETWQACGVLHVNHNDAETKRNHALSAQTWHAHLYHHLDRTQASQLAGTDVPQGGLFWQHGAWLNPASLIDKLLAQSNITLHTHAQMTEAQWHNNQWHIRTADHRHFSGSHMVICTGSNNPATPIIQDFPFQMIRGQTSLAPANTVSQKLQIALSGSSYLIPAWQAWHTYGASFINNDTNSDWREADEQHNQRELHALNPILAQALLAQKTHSGSLNQSCLKKGHAAVRCDSHDHLPVVGALGNVAAMRQIYAKLALDKNYRLNDCCPYYPNAYTNTAHGSRGLATAPICAAQIAAEICQTATPFSEKLRQALLPNRLIIRQIIRQSV